MPPWIQVWFTVMMSSRELYMEAVQRALSLAKEDEEDNNDLTEDPFADIRLDLVTQVQYLHT